MAMIICADCKKDVSTDAKTCPHCGAKVAVKGFPVKKVAIALLIVIGLSYYGPLAPCNRLRTDIRAKALINNPLGGVFTSMMSDSTIDSMITARYGELNPVRCWGALNDINNAKQ